MDTSKLSTLVVCMAISLGIVQAQPEMDSCLNGHNDLRVRAGAPPLTWDAGLAEKARAAAEGLTDIGCGEAPVDIPMDENIFPSCEANPLETVHTLMHTMEWESYAYDVTTQSCPEFYPCTHFLRMASPLTLRMGCSAVNNAKGGSVVVCFYDPPHPPVPSTPPHGLSVVTTTFHT